MPHHTMNQQPGRESKKKNRAPLCLLEAVSVQIKQERKRVMLDHSPAQPLFEGMPDSRIRKKKDWRKPLDSQMEINVFHGGKGIAIVESADHQE
jgi:hypothetical protein